MRSGDAALKRKVGRPRTVNTGVRREPWESPAITAQLDGILAALEAPAIDAETRGVFQRTLYRERYFGGDARGQVIMTCRCILESNGNENALIGPVVSAVHSVVTPALMDRGLALIEAFDRIPLLSILETMVGLDVFTESDLHHWYGRSIRNKLRAILEPRQVSKPARVKPSPKVPLSVTRVPAIEKNIALGVDLLALRMQHPSTKRYSAAVRRQFDIDAQHGVECSRAARVYGDRPDIYRRLSWDALLTLSSTPAPVRADLERRILAGERIGAPQIRRARQAHVRRQPDLPAARMAA